MLNKYKKDPTIQEDDIIGRYYGDTLFSAKITHLEKDKIICRPEDGDSAISGDTFEWEGYYFRVPPSRWISIQDLWAMKPMVEAPLLSFAGNFEKRIIYEDSNTFKWELPYANNVI